jgi:two-component sensor histidine kinase
MPLRFLDDLSPDLESALHGGDAIAESEHRIANNLAIVAAIIRSATVKLRNDPKRDFDAAVGVLADLSIRIEAIAQLHRLLIEHNQNQIELAKYLLDVVHSLASRLNGRLALSETNGTGLCVRVIVPPL